LQSPVIWMNVAAISESLLLRADDVIE
jgi:hypothetical protein